MKIDQQTQRGDPSSFERLLTQLKMVTVSDIPVGLQNDKSVTPYLARAAELAEFEPVISYYCKFYVLDYILTNKLHGKDKEIEAFTLNLLDEIEVLKKSSEGDESQDFQKVLNDKKLSIQIVMTFAFKLFNNCMESVTKYTGDQAGVASKIRATLVFLSLLRLFDENEDDISGATQGKITTTEEWRKLYGTKVKVLKLQLSKLIRGEIEIYVDEAELSREFDELTFENTPLEDEINKNTEEGEDASESNIPDFKQPSSPPPFIDAESDEGLPVLPGAPSTAPDDNEIHLPGAPSFLPDEDVVVPGMNDGPIHYIPKTSNNTKKDHSKPSAQVPVSTPAVDLTPTNITEILDTTEVISKAQKRCRFAISALNYEDYTTAEAELVEALELVRCLKREHR